MARFDIYLGDRLIGWSALESGDPPMGVAFGRFMPTVEYSGSVAASNDRNQAVLSVRTDTGAVLEAAGGVHMADHSAELGPDEATINIATGEANGYLPKRALGHVQEWRLLHQAELLNAWSLAVSQQPLPKIEPLE